jgi:hypothetical protein
LWNEAKNGRKPEIFVKKPLISGKNAPIFASFFHPRNNTIPDCKTPAAAAPRRRLRWRKGRINNNLWADSASPRRPSVSRETEGERSHNGTFS